MQKKTIVGLTEKVKIEGRNKSKIVMAKIDSGADRNSIDKRLVEKLELGPVIRTRGVKSSVGEEKRPVIRARLRIKNRYFSASFSVADRSHMKYKVLIGKNILKTGFLIDASK